MRGVKKIILPFIFIIFFSGYGLSQNYRLGFDFEVSQVRVIDQHGSRSILGAQSSPITIHLVFGYSPVDILNLNARIGKIFTWPEFEGMEYGINVKYNFFYKFFLTGGILVHSNEGGSVSHSWRALYATIPMVQLGTGIMVGTSFSLTVDYFVATSKKTIESYLLYGSDNRSTQKFESMIRFGFALGWDL